MLQKKHFDIMQFRYQGLSYPEIAKKVKISKDTIEGYFRSGGILEFEYETFARDQNKARISQAVELFKQNAESASDVMNKILQKAIARIEKAEKDLETELALPKPRVTKIEELERKVRGAENRAFDMAQIILDRAGLPVVAKTQIETTNPQKEDKEAIDERLRRAGIDPNSIRYRSQAPARA